MLHYDKLRTSSMRQIAFVLMALFISLNLWGQADANKGQIAGTVYDTSQAVVPGVMITIKNTATGATRTLMTNEVGEFRAVLLDPGTYEVTAEKAGFSQAVLKNVVLAVGTVVTLPINLQVIGITVDIEVCATLVATDMVAPSTIIDTQAIENLPINGRRFQDFAGLTPTVQVDQARGSISFV